jgi:LysR family transcriptional regulator, nitrogen assimilation regulatory protein
MELRQLRYFLGVCEAGSLLKASSRLHIAQPALGQQIAALEDELGVKLFARSTRGMALTPEGRVFLEHAKVVLTDADRAKEAVRHSATEPQGQVVLGLPTTVALAATVPIVQACRERYPRIQLQVIEAYSGFLREWLQMGRLDLALLFGDEPDPDLLKRVLLEEPLALVAPPGAAGLPRPLRLRHLQGMELVLPGREHGLRRIIDEACAQQGVALNVVAEIDSLTSVKKAVAAGVGNTILSESSVMEEVASGQLQAITIEEASMRRRVICATRITRPTTQASAAVIGLATDLIRGMVGTGAWPGQWIGEIRTR